MKVIEKLEKQIHEEIHDAKKYIKCALMYKDEDRDLSDMYYQLSQEEMGHMEKLHKMVVSIIEDYRKEKGEPPADMLTLYNYLHEQDIDEAAEVKMLISMYKG